MNSENSLYKVTPGPFNAEIELPTSKSHANRALIIGAIRGGGFQVNFLPESTDVLNMLSCLEKVGLRFIRIKDSVSFLNSFPDCEKETSGDFIDLQTGDGGTTNRFLLALLSRGRKTYRFFPSEKMSERPMNDLLRPLGLLSVAVEINKNGAWIEIKGPASLVKTSSVDIDCGKSTQFASAMMLAFSHLPLTINPLNVKASETYLEMTKYLLRESLYKSSIDVPVDFSSLSYPLALALAGGSVLIKNCRAIDPYQADASFIEIALQAGADLQWTPEGLKASSKNALKPFNVDGSRCPDLVPALVFLATQIEGESVLTNLSILRHKESDRLFELMKILKSCSIPFQFNESRAQINLSGRCRSQSPVTILPPRDHRMVMTAYLFLRAGAGGVLGEADCVDKSFPGFFQIMNGV